MKGGNLLIECLCLNDMTLGLLDLGDFDVAPEEHCADTEGPDCCCCDEDVPLCVAVGFLDR